MNQINLFYEEPDSDRWIRYDRYPRKVLRNLIRAKRRPGGVEMIALNLMKGLDKLGVKYRFNDFAYTQKHPEELACIIGKPHLLFERKWKNPVLFGAGVFSHPIDCPDLFKRYPVKKILVPGEWMRKMCEPYYGDKVLAWPVGIDTDEWKPEIKSPTVDFLIYNKVKWEYEHFKKELIQPITAHLSNRNLSYELITYGNYDPDQLIDGLARSKAVIFLSAHETQGIAYQQMLSTNTPIFAWDQGGYWPDPEYYPERVKFKPVSSVPYWDERCGMRFENYDNFIQTFETFWKNVVNKQFSPREYILDNLTLEKSAMNYMEIYNSVKEQL